MAQKQINPILKQVLELGPTVLFFLAYLRLKEQKFTFGGIEYDGFIVAATAFIPILLISMAILWKLTGKLSRIQVLTAVMVIVFGGLTVYFNDERFFKMKTTIVYGLFALVLGFGLLRGKSYLAYIMDEMVPMQPEGWTILTRALTLGFATLAIANEIIWRTMSTDTWVKLETFAFPVVLFAFLAITLVRLQKYMIEEDPDKDA